jgi:hypothetical protein
LEAAGRKLVDDLCPRRGSSDWRPQEENSLMISVPDGAPDVGGPLRNYQKQEMYLPAAARFMS